MIEQIISDYVIPIVMIIGLIEFVKHVQDAGRLTASMIMHVVFCLVAGLLLVLQGWQDGFTAGLVAGIAYKWLLLISMVQLFYSLVVKKIREAGGKVKGE